MVDFKVEQIIHDGQPQAKVTLRKGLLCCVCGLNNALGGILVDIGQKPDEVISAVCNQPDANGKRLFLAGKINMEQEDLSAPRCFLFAGGLEEQVRAAVLNPPKEA